MLRRIRAAYFWVLPDGAPGWGSSWWRSHTSRPVFVCVLCLRSMIFVLSPFVSFTRVWISRSFGTYVRMYTKRARVCTVSPNIYLRCTNCTARRRRWQQKLLWLLGGWEWGVGHAQHFTQTGHTGFPILQYSRVCVVCSPHLRSLRAAAVFLLFFLCWVVEPHAMCPRWRFEYKWNENIAMTMTTWLNYVENTMSSIRIAVKCKNVYSNHSILLGGVCCIFDCDTILVCLGNINKESNKDIGFCIWNKRY